MFDYLSVLITHDFSSGARKFPTFLIVRYSVLKQKELCRNDIAALLHPLVLTLNFK